MIYRYEYEEDLAMNKLQQQSLKAKDARYVTEIIYEGFAEGNANHAKMQATLDELLIRTVQPDTTTLPILFGGAELNREYYNLFVIGGEKFDGINFTVPKTKALVASIEPDVKKRFFNLHDDRVVEQILRLPSLFMSENADYMKSYPGQKALLGCVTELTVEPNNIRFSFYAYAQVYQQRITDISKNLGIMGNPGCSELNNTHWTIKRIDLMKALTKIG